MTESHTISCSIDIDTIISSIACELQDDDELDMSYDDIEELVQKYLADNNCFIDVDVKVYIDYETKEITDIHGA